MTSVPFYGKAISFCTVIASNINDRLYQKRAARLTLDARDNENLPSYALTLPRLLINSLAGKYVACIKIFLRKILITLLVLLFFLIICTFLLRHILENGRSNLKKI